jgi:hypothetical protein
MIDILLEPRGEAYYELLQLAKQHCTSFSLVWQDIFRFNESADNLKRILQPFLIREEHTNIWPGTELLLHKAQVCHYRLTDESVSILADASGLYAWLTPGMPEDLAFYAADDSCWLLSIAHENDAAIISESISSEHIRTAFPALSLCV